jgi:hypothetical protein
MAKALFLLVLFECLGMFTIVIDAMKAEVYIDKHTWIPFEEPKVPPSYPPQSNSWNQSDTTLFLAIASFRDEQCPKTLLNAFSKAVYPARLFIGVVQQNEEGDIDCLEEYCRLAKQNDILQGYQQYAHNERSCPFADNVRMDRVKARDAMGPTWARARTAKLLGPEEFCMQTDAHMDFVRNWDIKMMEMWYLTGNEYAVLSTYVAPTTQLAANEDGQKGTNGCYEVPHLCMVTLHDGQGTVRNIATKCARNLPHPKLTNSVWYVCHH